MEQQKSETDKLPQPALRHPRLDLCFGCLIVRCPLQAERGSAEVVTELIRRGAIPDAQSDPGGTTALHTAARSGRTDAVKALLRGADGKRVNPLVVNAKARRLFAPGA